MIQSKQTISINFGRFNQIGKAIDWQATYEAQEHFQLNSANAETDKFSE